MSTRVLFTSTRASRRLVKASAWLAELPAAAAVTILGHTPDSASELIRSLKRPVFGWTRTTLFHLATALARPRMLTEQRVLATPLALEALWARVVHQLASDKQLGRFAPLQGHPGLARALSRTAAELRLGETDPKLLEPSLANALAAYESALSAHHLADRALVFRWAQAAAPAPAPLLLLDLELRHQVERSFLASLVGVASSVLAVAPRADASSVLALEELLGVKAELLGEPRRAGPPGVNGALAALQDHLFSDSHTEGTAAWNDLISAPGEGRECVELARMLQEEAKRGVPFDAMAILLRAPETYRAPLEAALRRAGIPAHFARGTSRPDPSGRALLALLRCVEENLSASRFAEYLSLGQVPNAGPAGGPPPAAPYFVAAGDDVELEAPATPEPTPGPTDIDAPVVEGSLRAPRRWEKLLVDAAVIGGIPRWKSRLGGLREQLKLEAAEPDISADAAEHFARTLGDLDALEAFALPLLEVLVAFQAPATWGVWLERLSSLATRCLKFPSRVLSMLQELAPMADLGPVALHEVCTVLGPRITTLTDLPDGRRAGHVFVAPVDAARGLCFEVVLVPGLVERVFPQKLREDPLLNEAVRARLGLLTSQGRIAGERLALQLSVGAATRRALLSYPRMDPERVSQRVPSFYTLEAVRAVEGKLPGFEDVQRRAEKAAEARLGWPAPADFNDAIDETEFDLAVLEDIFKGATPVKSRAQYLLAANPILARALRARRARWSRQWTPSDGLVQPGPASVAALEAHQLAARSYSPTALQHFAACPYKFFLSAILRLKPLEVPEALEHLGPLERGSMSHAVQYQLLTTLRERGVEVTPLTLEPTVFPLLDQTLEAVGKDFEEKLAPAIDRIWEDALHSIKADLRQWLRQVADEPHWKPWRYELSFGLALRPGHDPASKAEAVPLDAGVKLRGSIDLVELSVQETVRATDYKTGKARAPQGNVVGGGEYLQPVLYALVLEKLLPQSSVDEGRYYYCTQAGDFSSVSTPLDAEARASMAQVIEAVGTSLKDGFFPAAPRADGCKYCDYKAVCGLDEERRVKLKPQAELKALAKVRGLR